MTSPTAPAHREPKIERKVSAATFSTALTSILVWILLTYVPGLQDIVEPLKIVVGFLVVSGSTFVSGYLARHTNRPGAETR